MLNLLLMCGFTFRNALALLKFPTDIRFPKCGDKYHLLSAFARVYLSGSDSIAAVANPGFLSMITSCTNLLLYEQLYAFENSPAPALGML